MDEVKRSMFDRRTGEDRRKVYTLGYFTNGGVERRTGQDRRSGNDRRKK